MSIDKFYNILALNADQALTFFLDSSRYCGFELPEYFEFNPLLEKIQRLIGETPFADCCCANPAGMEGVNLNITYNIDKKNGENPYDLALCRFVMGENVELWNNRWLKDEYSHLPLKSIINKKSLKNAAPIITFREARAYYEGV